MIIAVKTFTGKVIVRPDTTRVKDGEDAYMPEFISRLEWSPVLYTRITRPGRSISGKFAHRYFSDFSAGILLYPSDLMDGSEEGYACASCLDHTSLLNLGFPEQKRGENACNKIVIHNNNNVLYSENISVTDEIMRSIVQASKF